MVLITSLFTCLQLNEAVIISGLLGDETIVQYITIYLSTCLHDI